MMHEKRNKKMAQMENTPAPTETKTVAHEISVSETSLTQLTEAWEAGCAPVASKLKSDNWLSFIQ